MLANIVGGFIIGVWQKGMELEVALTNYTLLTIGEGLVAQIPALIISTAAGIMVTRSADENNFGHEITGQFLNYPKAFFVCSGVMFCFGLIPGLPHFAFFLLSGLAYLVGKAGQKKSKVVEEDEDLVTQGVGDDNGDQITAIRPVDLLELEVGYGLVPLVDAAQQGELLERIRSIRKTFAQKMGFIVPPIHIHDNLQLKPNEYTFLIKGAKVGGSNLAGQFLAMDSGQASGELEGSHTTEPVFGLPAVWIKSGQKEHAQISGYTVVDSTTIMATHISEIIKKHAHELVGRQELQQLLDNLATSCPKVVDELVPSLLSLGTVLKVVHGLLKENVSIRDLRTILEILADYGSMTKDPDVLTEFVRQGLGRYIVEQYKQDGDVLALLALDRQVEEIIAESVQPSEQGGFLAIEPGVAQRILQNIRQGMDKFNQTGSHPVLLASPSVRRHVKKLTERFLPSLAVLSHNEIPSNIKIQSIGVVSADAN
jgi:flagellar biosynthesis protein FlhA